MTSHSDAKLKRTFVRHSLDLIQALKHEIRRAMLANSYHMSLLIDAFQLAHDLEISLRFPSDRRFPSKTEQQLGRQFESSTKPGTSTGKDPKGKSVIGESSQQGTKGTMRFRCQGFSFFAAQCHTRTLLTKGALDEDSHEYVEEVYVPEDSANDVE